MEILRRFRPHQLVATAALLSALIVIGTALTAPVDRDEHMYAAAATLPDGQALYRDVVFTHPPLSAWWYGAAVDLWPGDEVLLPMRLAQGLVLLALGGTLFGVFRRLGAGSSVAALLVLLLVNLDVFRESMGAARSHELALLMAMAPWLVLPIYSGDDQSRWRLLAAGALAGLAIMTRHTYLPLAMLAVAWPALVPTVTRDGRREVLWTLLGCVVSLGLVVWLARDAHGTVLRFGLWDYHLLNVRFHELEGLGKGMTVPQKLDHLRRYYRHTDLAVWSTLVLTALVTCGGWSRPWSLLRWRLAQVMLVCGAVMMLVPRPAQIGYDEAWLVGGAMVVAAATARLAGRPKQVMLSVLGLGVLVCLVHHGGDTVGTLQRAAHPGQWPAVSMHATGRRLDAALDDRSGHVLTTHALYALEAGRPIDPALATGEFVWRLDGLVPDDVRGDLGLVTPGSLGLRLATFPPAALIAVAAAPWDAPLSEQARQLGWRMQPLAGGVVVWLPPPLSGDSDIK